ncbi:MAG: pseudouridine synthase [Elusimicrobiota bacterium]
MPVRAPVVVLFYKPYGVLSQFTPLDGHPSLADFGLPPKVYAAGRLDHDSEGLLVLTDDGGVQSRLSHPGHGHTKTYWAQVERVPSPEALAALHKGVKLRDGWTKPCKARLLTEEPSLPPRTPPIRARKSVPTAWLEITLGEGKNRQVRRMTAAIGHPTLRLVRVRVGPYALAGLAPGRWRRV